MNRIIFAALIQFSTGILIHADDPDFYTRISGGDSNAELREAVLRDKQLFNAHDFEGYSKILDEDVVMVFPGHPAAKGRREAVALIKTVRIKGSESITHEPLADYHMGDYYLTIVPYTMMNEQNEEIDSGTILDFYQKKNGKLLKKALFVVSSLTPWPVKKP